MSDLAYLVVVVFLTAYAQTIVGFGFALLAVPIMVLRLDVQAAVVLSSILGTASSGLRAWSLRRSCDAALARTYLWFTLAGAPFGLALFVRGDMQALKIIIGLSVFVGIAVLWRGTDLRSAGPILERSMGFVSGVLLTSTSTNGPPLVLGLQARQLDPDVFRSTIAAIFFVSGVASVVVFAAIGEVTRAVVVYAVAAMPTVVLANKFGLITARRVSPMFFRKLVMVLLGVAGASAIVSALTS